MIDYRRVELKRMVVKAKESLAGTCPLVEDEAIIWAMDKIIELEKLTKLKEV